MCCGTVEDDIAIRHMPRVIDIDGGVNFRDFGGYPTVVGNWVVAGKLFRCGTLANITPMGLATFHGLGIRHICDLRRNEERVDDPTPLPPENPKQTAVSIGPGNARSVQQQLRSRPTNDDQRIKFMVAIHEELVHDHTEAYRKVFAALLATRDGGFLVHCTAGKDRTGLAAALILASLGVDRESIEEDYLLTNSVIDFEGFILPRVRQYFGSSSLDLEMIKSVAGVRVEYLRASFQAMEKMHGSIDGYLERGLGLDARDFTELKRRYVVTT